jgi:chromosome segregation ATPase
MAAIDRLTTAEVLVPIQQNQAHLPEAEPSGCLQHIWNVFCGEGTSLAQTITSIFLLVISFLAPPLAIIGAISGHLMVIYLRWKSSTQEGGLREEIGDLQGRNRGLNDRIQELVNQVEGFRVTNDRLTWEKDQAIQERDRLVGQRQELILSHAPVLNERDRLQDENHDLLGQIVQARSQRDLARNQNAQLNLEREAAINEKRQIEEDYRNALQELGGARAQLERVDDHRQLNQHLARFHELYLQVEGGEARGATRAALEELIPQYKTHRERLHGMLRRSIDTLPANDLNRMPLNGILRLSEEEVDHLERISQTLHLIDELRAPLAEYLRVQPEQPQAAEAH